MPEVIPGGVGGVSVPVGEVDVDLVRDIACECVKDFVTWRNGELLSSILLLRFWSFGKETNLKIDNEGKVLNGDLIKVSKTQPINCKL